MILKYNKEGYPYEDQESADLEERIEQLEKQKELLKFHCKKAGETIKTLQKEVEELKANLARAREDHQYDNLVHQNELDSLRKKGLV